MTHGNRKLILELIFKSMKWIINIFFKPNSVKIRRKKYFFIHQCLPTFTNNPFSIAQSYAKGSFKSSLNIWLYLMTTHPRRFKAPKDTVDSFRSLQLFQFLKSISGHLLATKSYLFFYKQDIFPIFKIGQKK